MDATIRLAGAADAAHVVELRAEMFRAMGTDQATVADPGWRDAFLDWLVDALDDNLAAVALAELADGRIVSSAVGQVLDHPPSPTHTVARSGRVGSVCTYPEFRGRGLGSACVAQVLAWFRESTDVQVVDLSATQFGVGIYRRLGFVEREYPNMRMRLSRR